MTHSLTETVSHALRLTTAERLAMVFDDGALIYDVDTDLLYVGDGDTPGGVVTGGGGGGGGAAWGSITGTLSDQTDLQSALDAKENLLPSQTGNAGKFLTTNGTAKSWGTVTDPVWGAITGTLSDQTDLQAALDDKLDVSAFVPAGADTEVQFNDGGSFGADSTLTFNSTTKVLTANQFKVGTAFKIKTGTNNTAIFIGDDDTGAGAINTGQAVFIGGMTGSGAINATNSIFIGTAAGFDAVGAFASTFLGEGAGYDATNAAQSSFVGPNAGRGATNANSSSFFGSSAGFQAINASSSNFIGTGAGSGATNAGNSNFIGTSAGDGAHGAGGSNFFGAGSGVSAYNASNSSFIGPSAGDSAFNASNSNFFGNLAGYAASNAANSNFIGASTGFIADNASNSNFFGYRAGGEAAQASNSNFFGYEAGDYAVQATNSIFIGYYSGNADSVDNTSNPGDWSIAIGPYSGTGGFSNSIAIGRGVINTSQKQFNIGDVLYGTGIYDSDTQDGNPISGGRVGVGTDAPDSSLHVVGETKTTTLTIGGGQEISAVFSATKVIDFPSISSNSYADETVTVTGASLGDVVSLGLPNIAFVDMGFTAWVSAANTVTIRARNPTGGAIDLASGTYRVMVTRFV